MSPTVILSTDRLRLREWTDADAAPFAAINADPEVMEYLGGPLTRAASDTLLARIRANLAADGFGLYATELKQTAELIGFVGLSRPPFDAPFMPAIEIAWRLARPSWGKGIATEAARAVIAHAFAALGLVSLVSFTTVGNWRSRRLMERIGMSRNPADDFDHPNLSADHPLRRHVLHRLMATDWHSSG